MKKLSYKYYFNNTSFKGIIKNVNATLYVTEKETNSNSILLVSKYNGGKNEN